MSRFQKKRFKLLSPSDIFDFHEKLIARHGGSKGNYPDSLAPLVSHARTRLGTARMPKRGILAVGRNDKERKPG